MLEKQARLISGVILAVYVFLHVINHCLGLVSIDAMDAMLDTVMAPWKTVGGGVLFAGTMLVHAILALVSLYRRRQREHRRTARG